MRGEKWEDEIGEERRRRRRQEADQPTLKGAISFQSSAAAAAEAAPAQKAIESSERDGGATSLGIDRRRRPLSLLSFQQAGGEVK